VRMREECEIYTKIYYWINCYSHVWRFRELEHVWQQEYEFSQCLASSGRFRRSESLR
jgi:hypothetical protein